MTLERRRQYSWALYDWGNSAFATTVIAGLFPIFFEQYWASTLDSGTRTFWLGVASSVSSLVVVLLAPLLGSIADRGGLKKRFLAMFSAVGILSTAAFYWVGQGQWMAATVLFTLGSIGFQAGTSFYDSLIVNVADDDQMDRVSSLGYGLGYLGGGSLFALNVAMVLKPALFGLADAASATRVSFLLVAIWWAVFAIPLLRNVPEARVRTNGAVADLVAGLRQLRSTLVELGQLRPVWMFLLAYWLYIDGVDTVIRMAVDYGLTLGFASSSLITALLMVQFIGFPAAIGFGWIAGKLGTKRGLYLALTVYIAVTCYAYLLENVTQFYLMAAAIGLVQGGVQALSRSYYARLIPAGKSGEFFGFYNMLGKFAAVLGPIAVGVTKLVTGDARLSILILVLFFVGGMLLLSRVPAPKT
ncbi:MFS transporter, UMF1 family [Hydrocarboniphaga daqingensis]|uniref:MFS transporter, UMF1 family n=1 Tax=Hydrocarboniphaga daqingensis TaxID=490188 RepID=A0A1M5S4S5_9GAMM|nr:MFS transporter [Hydrocarboniphaga daqingensis]SHH33440.1 MFS transporter, UMF1 family [Hydrocarboniphaga daqingensis]